MTANLPSLPKIEGDTVDIVLDVYTHKSLRPAAAELNHEYGDADRLAELGAKILELAVTFHYYSKKPMLTASELTDKSSSALSDANIVFWLDNYGLRNKLRYAPSEKDNVNTPHELRRFFNTYVGAVYIRNGMHTVQDWLSRLIDPDADPAPHYPGLDPTTPITPPHQNWNSPPPQPPSSPPPPLPPSISSPTSVGSPNFVTLALVNQTAMQRGFAVTYQAEQTGPPHLPTWTVRCYINGGEQGRGTGKSQKLAKEDAARQAWVRMGW